MFFAGSVLEVVKNLRATHTAPHATTIRATAEYLIYFVRSNNQDARRKAELLECEASAHLREGHPVLEYIARLGRGWDDLVFADLGNLTISSGT